MYQLLLFLVLCFAINASGQTNLVPNGSFEQHSQCPDNNSYVHYATGWWGVNNTPDYFNACDTFFPPLSFGVPNNLAGSQMPFDGNAYVGIILYDLFGPNYREVIGCQLADSLVIGSSYSLSLRISRAGGEGFNWAANKMGMRFSNIYYTSNNTIPIDNGASVYEDTVLGDSTNWVLLKWHFTPSASMKYLYLGNFFDDANTDTINYEPQQGHAYYYIDSVEVRCESGCFEGITVNSPHKPCIIYDPQENTLTATCATEPLGKLQLFDATGRLIKQQTANSKLNANDLPPGYYIGIFTSGTTVDQQKIFIH